MSSSLKFDKHSLITITIITMDNSASSPQNIPLHPIILSPSARPRQAVISCPKCHRNGLTEYRALASGCSHWAESAGRLRRWPPTPAEQGARRARAALAFSGPRLRHFGLCLQVLETMKTAVNMRVQASCERRFRFS